MIKRNLQEATLGEEIEKAVRNSNIPLTRIANALTISRATLYARFMGKNITDAFIAKLADVLKNDFSNKEVFPRLYKRFYSLHKGVEEKSANYGNNNADNEFASLMKKYIQSLEYTDKLIKFLLRISNNNQLYAIRKEIEDFLIEKDNYSV